MPKPAFPITDAALNQAQHWLETNSGGIFAHLLFMGDKHLLYAAEGRCLIQYKPIRNRIVALGDPIGAEEDYGRALLEFRDFADRHDLDPVCYEVAHKHLHLYHDCGFALLKIGEMGQVLINEFTVSGQRNQSLRGAVNRAIREGLTLELLQPPVNEMIWAQLKIISDAWLHARSASEKSFSLGAFERDYLSRSPLFLVRKGQQIIAFSNLTPSYQGRQELSVDLMRHLPNAPYGTMDFLFTRIIEWGRDEGYIWFNLGMAPLSGVGNIRYARPDERLARLAYDYGSHLYNYKGLRSFKEKFHPIWESRYIAYPLSRSLPQLLVDLAALIAGGYRQILTKP
jgi:phosphatidylglycerol lysyltransferase